MLHFIRIVRRTDLASAPWEIEVNNAAISLHDDLPTKVHLNEAISRYDELTKDVQD